MTTPTEGRQAIGERLYNGDNTDFTGLELGLFTNPSDTQDPDYLDPDTATLADILEAAGGGYARIALPLSGWTISGGDVSRPEEAFVADATGYNAAITGAFIATTGTTPRLLHFDYADTPTDMTQAYAKHIVDLATVIGG